MKIMHFEMGRTLVGGPQQVIYIVKGLAQRAIDCVVAGEPNTPLSENSSPEEGSGCATFPMVETGISGWRAGCAT